MYEGRLGLIKTLFLYQAKVVTDVSVMVLMEIVIDSPATTNAWAGKESTPVEQYFCDSLVHCTNQFSLKKLRPLFWKSS